jgi:hypothetical protein|nr:MAG TPA: hypothetical protein [Caudoviricetes sp.]
MAKLNAIIKKLQKAILSKRLVIKISTSQFYSKDQDRMITMTTLSTPTLQMSQRTRTWKIKDYEILRTSSQVDVVMCLKDIWETVERWD